jgi:hypothetical protein
MLPSIALQEEVIVAAVEPGMTSAWRNMGLVPNPCDT